MSDSNSCHSSLFGNNPVFSQYMHHHAQMSNWVQQLHSNFPPFPPHQCHSNAHHSANMRQSIPLPPLPTGNCCPHQPPVSAGNCCPHQPVNFHQPPVPAGNYCPHQPANFHQPPVPAGNCCLHQPMNCHQPPLHTRNCCPHQPMNSVMPPHHGSCSSHQSNDYDHHSGHPEKWQNETTYENEYDDTYYEEGDEPYAGETEIYDEDYEEEDDNSGTGLVLNVEAILAMRAEKAKIGDREEATEEGKTSSKKSGKMFKVSDESDFEFIEDENTELYLELDDFGKVQRKHGKKTRPHTARDMREEQEIRQYVYGDQSNKIAGLETSMQITFDHLSDTLQPHLWPVLPIRL